MQLLNPDQVLTDLLGADADDKVIVTIGNWVEMRCMQTTDGKVVLEQRREKDGEWILTEYLEPNVDNWYWVAQNAFHMKLPVPEIAWLGPLENIPDALLLSDEPLNVRRVDKMGWINLRMTIKERCEAEA